MFEHLMALMIIEVHFQFCKNNENHHIMMKICKQTQIFMMFNKWLKDYSYFPAYRIFIHLFVSGTYVCMYTPMCTPLCRHMWRSKVFLDTVGSLPLYSLSSDLNNFRLKIIKNNQKVLKGKFSLAAHQELHCICGDEER